MSLAVAAVVPTYGRAPFLETTLASLARQTVPAAEVVVVDDGSEPPTSLPTSLLPLRLLRRPHEGIAAARNAGVLATTAPLVHICDHDDLLEPTFYERLLESAAGDARAAIVHADCGFIGALGEVLPGRLPGPGFARRQAPEEAVARLLHWNPMASIATVFRRELWEALGGFRDLAFVQDWDFWLRAATAGAAFRFVPEPLAWHRVHDGQQSAPHRRAEIVAETVRMLATAPLPLRCRWSRARSIARLRLELAALERDRGRRLRALCEVARSAPLAPRAAAVVVRGMCA